MHKDNSQKGTKSRDPGKGKPGINESKSQNSWGSAEKPKGVICFNCIQEGHVVKECPYKEILKNIKTKSSSTNNSNPVRYPGCSESSKSYCPFHRTRGHGVEECEMLIMRKKAVDEALAALTPPNVTNKWQDLRTDHRNSPESTDSAPEVTPHNVTVDVQNPELNKDSDNSQSVIQLPTSRISF